MTREISIDWPDRYRPENTAAHVRNEILIAAAPDRVWAWLVEAARWPEWYPNAREVRLADGRTRLFPGAVFDWRTFGFPVHSTVREFIPEERIAWDGTGLGLDVYHAWLLVPRDRGTWVLTEENQNGVGARLQSLFAPNRMSKWHQVWLERLRERAESGALPSS